MLSRTAFALIMSSLLAGVVFAQDEEQVAASKQPRKPPDVVAEMQKPVHVPTIPRLLDGAEVRLLLVEPIKAKTAAVGDRAEFVLVDNLYYRSALIAKAGTPVEATVVEASRAKWASRGSKLTVEITALPLVNSQRLPLRGEASTRGGVGSTAHVVGELIDTNNSCGLCDVVLIPVGLVSLFAPGRNKDLQRFATAFIDGDFILNPVPVQPQDPGATGKVLIVRGAYGWPYGRDLYCNGIPLAHLDAKHKLELTLHPGQYRFAINPKKEVLEIYVAPGSETRIITTYDDTRVMSEHNVNLNTYSPSLNPLAKGTSEEKLLHKAHPANESDVYTTACDPLAEVPGSEASQ
jgi:hypothetical protein